MLGLMRGQRCLEKRQLAIGLEPAEPLLHLLHRWPRPAQCHRCVLPVLHSAAGPANRAVHVLDDTGAGQRPALPVPGVWRDCGSSSRHCLHPPFRMQDVMFCARKRGNALVKTENIARLMNLAPLNGGIMPKHPTDRRRKCLRPIDNEQPAHVRVQTPVCPRGVAPRTRVRGTGTFLFQRRNTRSGRVPENRLSPTPARLEFSSWTPVEWPCLRYRRPLPVPPAWYADSPPRFRNAGPPGMSPPCYRGSPWSRRSAP